LGHGDASRRSSVVSLIAALVLSLPFYPILVFILGDSAEGGNATLVFVFVAPAIGWMILVAYIGRLWWTGWTSVWKIPLLVLMCLTFWLALLLFIKDFRRAMLPGRPRRPGSYCESCGAPWRASDARYCGRCGAARSEIATV
jgi:hypothetical protein